jgi:hypothetical protein
VHEAGERTFELGGKAQDRGRIAAGAVLQIGRERGGTDGVQPDGYPQNVVKRLSSICG